ncbi:MAG: biotin transporter BioY [SAR324 cluster bacterium]|nr:biotin transporter BioY [SAR324 cluster bacterium]
MLKSIISPLGGINTESKYKTYAFHMLAILAGSIVLWASAKFKIPFYPVPFTMQTLFIFLLSAVYGYRLGGATLLTYVAAGAMGLPIFAGTPEMGVGMAYILGPTGGYIIGFVIASFLLGYLWQKSLAKTFYFALLACTLATGVIFLCGWAWLAYHIGGLAAFTFGVWPFWASALLKILIAALLIPKLHTPTFN